MDAGVWFLLKLPPFYSPLYLTGFYSAKRRQGASPLLCFPPLFPIPKVVKFLISAHSQGKIGPRIDVARVILQA